MLQYIAINRDTVTHISKKKLDKKTEEKLYAELTRLFAASGAQHARLFNVLFTHTEKIMYTKRLAMILMVSKGLSTYTISKTLKVSDSTVRIIRAEYNKGYYDPIIKASHHKTFHADKFWKTVEMLLRAGMPSYGKDRWKWLDDNLKN